MCEGGYLQFLKGRRLLHLRILFHVTEHPCDAVRIRMPRRSAYEGAPISYRDCEFPIHCTYGNCESLEWRERVSKIENEAIFINFAKLHLSFIAKLILIQKWSQVMNGENIKSNGKIINTENHVTCRTISSR